jgi:nucleotide-binding universal stress UspA family protein
LPLGRLAALPAPARELRDPIPEDVMSRIRRIVCASDFSPGSGPALAAAEDLAKALKAELVVVHALVPIVTVGGVYPPYVGLDALERAARARARAELDRLAAAARKRGLRATAVLAKGFAADQIVRVARSRKAGLIVMGTHGRSGLSRVVMGSVAMRVAAGAPCPVMTVRSR